MSNELFELICFDSNQLLANGWPFLSEGMRYFIKLASDLGVGICLPKPVLFEIRTNFLDKLENDIRRIWSDANNIMKKLNTLGVKAPGVMPQRSERQQICECYDSAQLN
jgi:hypothetical protein